MAPVAAEPISRIRKKIFYKINEVSKLTGLKPYILRYWETEFPQISPEKDENDQRRYRQEDIDVVLKIKDLLYERKFTIAGAKQQLTTEMSGTPEEGRSQPAALEARPAAPAVAPRAQAPAARPASAPPFLLKALKELSAVRSELEDLLSCLG